MNENTRFELLRKLAREAKNYPDVIIKTAQGYRIFGKYDLKITAQGVDLYTSRQLLHFTASSTALKYCAALERNDIATAEQIFMLDNQLNRAETAIELHRQRIRQGRNVDTHLAKLDAAVALKNHALTQLSKYKDYAKYYQPKGIQK